MKICHYSGADSIVEGGVKSSMRQQRKALEMKGVEYTEDPSEDYDILHLNVIGPLSIFQLFKANIKGKPVIYHVHSTVEDFRDSFRFSNLLAPLFDRLTRFIYSRADLLLPVSEYTRDLLEQKVVETPKRVVWNSFSPERLDGFEQKEGLEEKYDVDNFTVVNLGWLFKRKGLDDFVLVAEQMPETDFLWFGGIQNRILNSRETKKWKKRAPENLSFPGYVEDVRDVFALGDVFFFPSRQEHQPIALIEALYCGMPIVLRDIPQYDGWLEDGKHCIKASSREDFEEAIRKLKTDQELRNKLSDNARDIADKHRRERLGEQLQDIYNELAGN